MGRLNPKCKILGFLSLVILGFLLAPFVAIQVQEWKFRYRAGRLLADMCALQLHQAGVEETQMIFKRWNHNERPICCWFETHLSLGDMDSDTSDSSDWNQAWQRLFKMFGGHYAQAKAGAVVDDRRAWKSFYFEIELWTMSVNDPRNDGQDNLLSGSVGGASRLSAQHVWHGLTLHPHYVVDEARVRHLDPRTPDVSILFDSQADPKDVLRLAKFDLSCVTALWPCRRPDQLMPEAAAQYSREEPQLERERKEHICSPQIISLMARDADNEGVVTVTEIDPWGGASVPVVRLEENLKSEGHWKADQKRRLLVFVDDGATNWGHNLPPEVQIGRQFILLAPSSPYEPRSLEVERCGIVPLNPGNLQLVRSAIAEKHLPPTR